MRPKSIRIFFFPSPINGIRIHPLSSILCITSSAHQRCVAIIVIVVNNNHMNEIWGNEAKIENWIYLISSQQQAHYMNETINGG